MPSNGKYYCPVDDWAAKTPCPIHPGQSIAMGTRWRPGRKGSRKRIWDLQSSWNRQMPPAKPRYHVFYGVPALIQELGVKSTKESAEAHWYWKTAANAVFHDIRDRSLKQRQRRRRNRR